MKVGAERRSHPDSRDSSSAMSKSDGNATDDIPEQSQIQNNPREINKQDHRILVDARDVEEHGEDDDWGSSEAGAESGSLKSSRSLLGIFHTKNTTLLVSIILMLGFASAIAFTAIGLTGALRTENEEFVREASATAVRISDSFSLYANAASLIHARCRHRDFTRTDFRELYEYVVASDLEFKAMQFSPNITHEERPEAEAESRQFYAENYPHVNYQGFRGFNALNATTLEPRWNESFYFPIHYQEPVLGNEAAIDLDYYSSESRRRAVNALFEHKRPSMTDRLSLVKEAGQVSRCGDHGGPSFGIVLMHPGVPLSTDDPDADVWPRDFAAIVLCVPDLLTSSTVDHTRAVSVYIHDLSHPGEDDVFLGAAQLRSVTDALGNNESDKVVVHSSKSAATAITFLGEKNLDQLTHDNRRSYQEDIEVANRVWTVTVVDEEDRFNSSMLFVLLGGFLIVLASVFLAIWVRHNDQRTRNFNALQADAEQEKASLVLQSARQAAKTERELNDFIAHEVRNPVAAAMAATNFVKMELIKSSPLSTAETIDQAREDIGIIDQSLQFVNDLLRNMLDMHRAKSKQMQVTMAPTDLLHDVLEPVAGMLRRVRNNRVQILVDCPENMFVITDALRLKQVVLNLGRNSSKFIEEGFIRLSAHVASDSDGTETVKVFVDDSGCGIPPEKRTRLFAKFQESLDLLSQGTVSIHHVLARLLIKGGVGTLPSIPLTCRLLPTKFYSAAFSAGDWSTLVQGLGRAYERGYFPRR